MTQVRPRLRASDNRAGKDDVLRFELESSSGIDCAYVYQSAMTKAASAIEAHTREDWRSWLENHHAREEGVWLVTFKKSSGMPHLDYNAAVEEALCFGWVDSKPGKVDEKRSKLWFSPRKRGTGWSRPNKERVARLIASGLMCEAGRIKIEAAKNDGSWSKLDAVEALDVPADLTQAFQTHPGSMDNFEAFPRSVKRGILEWLVQAKKPETRAARLEETARLAAENKRANQWVRK